MASSYSVAKANANYIDTIPSGAPSGGAGSNKVGVYYNYCAASAGSYCYGDGSSSGTSSGNAQYDLCPKGWRMPTSGGSNGELHILYTAYSSNATSFRNALSLPLSGGYSEASASGLGSWGGFWSSTRSDDDDMYILDLMDASRVEPSSIDYRKGGSTVRCIRNNS